MFINIADCAYKHLLILCTVTDFRGLKRNDFAIFLIAANCHLVTPISSSFHFISNVYMSYTSVLLTELPVAHACFFLFLSALSPRPSLAFSPLSSAYVALDHRHGKDEIAHNSQDDLEKENAAVSLCSVHPEWKEQRMPRKK